MSLTLRKLIVVGCVLAVVVTANIILIAGWLDERGVIDFARGIRAEYLTGTAVTVIAALLVVLVSPGKGRQAATRRCGVCNGALPERGRYCTECGSRV